MEIFGLSVGPLGANCFIVAKDGIGFVIDPGGEPSKIIAQLEEKNITPKAILLTHGHVDHIGAAEALRTHYGLKIYIHQEDWDFTIEPEKNLSQAMLMDKISFESDEALPAHFEIGNIHIQTLHTPGHTPGSVCFLIGHVLFTGDTLFRGSIGRTDLYGGDYGKMMDSLSKLRLLEEECQIFPGHGPGSMLQEEIRNNPYMGGL